MLKTISIVPTILTNNKLDYRAQIERINSFSKRAQIDITDGIFAKSETILLSNVWWPKGWEADLHLMLARPSLELETILKLKPSLCILHAEAKENLLPIFEELKKHGIKTGVAILPKTYPGDVRQYIEAADSVLIFAGKLGEQGAGADMMQIEKVNLIRNIKAEVEISWDGGANLQNIRALAHSGIDVINVGSALSRVDNPAEVYEQMVAETDKNGVVL